MKSVILLNILSNSPLLKQPILFEEVVGSVVMIVFKGDG